MRVSNGFLKCTFLFLIIAVTSFAQNTENSLDQLYVPIEGSIFDDNSENGDGTAYREHKNIVFYNPFLLFRSIGAIHYQRSINDYFSLYAGIGSAFGKDLIMQVGSQADLDIFDNSYAEHNISDILQDGELQSNLNLFLNAGAKLYYDSFWGFDYGFVGLDYRYSKQGFDYSYTQYLSNGFTNSTTTSDFNIDVQNHNFNFLFGVESTSAGKVCMFHSLYWGFGIRSIMYDEIENEVVTSTFGTSNDVIPALTGQKANYLSATFLLGYKFGIGW